MFFDSSRIEQNKEGILFYEQDVLYSDYLFTNDVLVDITLDYNNYGFGLILFENRYEDFNKVKNKYLIKIGKNSYTVYYNSYSNQNIIVNGSCNIDIQKNLNIKIKKQGFYIEVLIEGEKEFEFNLDNEYPKFNLGIYSNKNNLIKNMNISSYTPKLWDFNINNTNGGRFFFKSDMIVIQNCVHEAEIEQSNIFLEKGRYYLKYETEEIDNLCDIETYVYLSSDNEFTGKKKNLLDINNVFILEEDNYVDVRIEGTSGLIKYIAITPNSSSKYISTYDTYVNSEGSLMIINKVSNLSKITFSGVINSIPDVDLMNSNDYYIVSNNICYKILSDLNIETKKEYYYEYDVLLNIFNIKDIDNNIIYSCTIEPNDADKLYFFYNISGYIDDLELTDIDGGIIKPGLSNTTKFYVPDTVKSPIVITDEFNTAFDLSSSFREIEKEDGTIKYIFTNTEREVFNTKIMKVSKRIANIRSNINIYGILNDSEIIEDNIFSIKENFNNIDKYCNKYINIPYESYSVNYEDCIIEIDKDFDDKDISYYIIDYLKEDSYCINKVDSLSCYEVDVSTNKEKLILLCDNVNNAETINQNKEFLITNIVPNSIKYIYLKK